MSVEARVTVLEHKVEQLDYAFRANNKILETTHGVVSLILNEQRDKFKEINANFDEQFKKINARFDAQSKEMNARFDKQEAFNQQVNENFKQIELLITQLHPGH